MQDLLRYTQNVDIEEAIGEAQRSGRRIPSLLIMTATVTPPAGVPNLRRTDVKTRRADYAKSLRFYLGLRTSIIDRIVLLENSRSDLEDLWGIVKMHAADKQVEFVSFDGLDYPPEHGRGFGEYKMLDYGFAASRLLRRLRDDDVVWKVTGRLRITNLEAMILQSAKLSYAVLCDFRRWPQRAVDWRVMSCTRDGYRQVYEGKYPEFRENVIGVAGESRDFERLESVRTVYGVVPRFPVQPLISGISGEHNSDYYSGLNVGKYWLRVAARRLVPWIWI